jgi:hypothetical protein
MQNSARFRNKNQLKKTKKIQVLLDWEIFTIFGTKNLDGFSGIAHRIWSRPEIRTELHANFL